MKRLMVILTAAGGLPFILPALALAYGYDAVPWLAGSVSPVIIQLTYGAIIISFLAGVYWGQAMREESSACAMRRILWSNMLALLAWSTLLMHSMLWALMMQLSLFFISWMTDMLMVKRNLLPEWYGKMRAAVSVIVLLSLATSVYLISRGA